MFPPYNGNASAPPEPNSDNNNNKNHFYQQPPNYPPPNFQPSNFPQNNQFSNFPQNNQPSFSQPNNQIPSFQPNFPQPNNQIPSFQPSFPQPNNQIPSFQPNNQPNYQPNFSNPSFPQPNFQPPFYPPQSNAYQPYVNIQPTNPIQYPKLNIGVPHQGYSGGFTCNSCLKTFGPGKSFWHEDGKAYDLCEECYFKSNTTNLSHYSGSAKSGLPNKIFSNSPFLKINCDICNTQNLIFYFHKDDTQDYTLCQNCYQKAYIKKNEYTFYDKLKNPPPELPKKIIDGIPRIGYEKGYECDECHTFFEPGNPFFHCSHPVVNDNYDLCPNCFYKVGKNSPYLKDFSWYTGKPKVGIPENYTSDGSVACDKCKNGNLKQFFHKSYSNYDLCRECYENGKYSSNEFIYYQKPKEQKKPIFGVPRAGYLNGFICNSCKLQFDKGTPFFHCKICGNYDLCEKCYLQNGHTHKMDLYSSIPVNWPNPCHCDVCGKKNLNRFYHKKGYNYDLCEKCFVNRKLYDRTNNDYIFSEHSNFFPLTDYSSYNWVEK